MSEPCQILLVEDSVDDAVLLEYALKRGHIDARITRVETRDQYVEALAGDGWDVVLSDFLLPTFGADEALKLLLETHSMLPFIVVSGKVDEHEAVSLLRTGADHFVSKHDMGHLAVVVERAVSAARRRREMAGELEKHREHLQDLVAERTVELEDSNRRLQLEIQERERMEEAVRESEIQYRDLVESALDGICILQDQKLQFANPPLAEMLSYDLDSIIGTNLIDYFAPEESERMVGLYRRIVKGEEDSHRYEATLMNRRGRRVAVSVGANAIEYHGRRAVMVVVRDISEQKRTRQIALQSERLEAVGVVARGVGNNFTNIMSVISSYAATISDSFLPHTRPHNAARKILEASRHAGDLTKRLLSVVRVCETETKAHVGPVSLAKTIKKARDLIGHSLGACGVDIVIKKIGPLPYVMADQSQLLDTLMNIFLNGADAMPEGGTLTLDLVERRIAKPRSNPNATGGTYVGLSIQDTGVGMSKEQIAHVFEPFFTTKDSQEAFGLGLPVAQSMAQSWGGWIDIRSRIGKGTRVRVFMAKAEPPPEAIESDIATRPQTVLVVDDNAGRRGMMTQALKTQGHTVIEFADGEEATQCVNTRGDEIDLFVIDWLIPKKDGKSVLQAVLDRDPQAKVIMVSGFSRDFVRSQVRMGAWRFLQKPFSTDEFTAMVTDVCRQDGAGRR